VVKSVLSCEEFRDIAFIMTTGSGQNSSRVVTIVAPQLGDPTKNFCIIFIDHGRSLSERKRLFHSVSIGSVVPDGAKKINQGFVSAFL